ncbi:MAG: hypothetical protein HFG26_06335 [Provencibacterium sp.]|nr:hypothetical protein [Provencibacterium sp.]
MMQAVKLDLAGFAFLKDMTGEDSAGGQECGGCKRLTWEPASGHGSGAASGAIQKRLERRLNGKRRAL